ncbi:MAG TPA: hypothetical protein VGE47_06485 [Burkholderiaceae bacterium]
MKNHSSPPSLGAALRPTWVAALLALGAVLSPLAQASQLVPQNLTQMIAKADRIVTGRVMAVKDGISAEGVPFTEVTLKLSEGAQRGLKSRKSGRAAAPGEGNYTFRQYGLLKPRRMGDGRYMLPAKIEGMPTWRVGEQVMSFMNKPAARTGLVTPVGLAQGKLTISGSKAANSFNNVGLFDKVQINSGLLRGKESAMLGQNAGGVELEVLQGLVQRAIRDNWVSTGAMR